MGCESPTSITCSSAEITCSPTSGKRSREPEDEAYLDNFQSHKKYLSEAIASSMNGLTFVDSLKENLMEYPPQSESISRDEFRSQYSPMSEDLDESQYPDALSNTSITTVSPHCHWRPSPARLSTLQQRRHCSESNGLRFPPSPSDACHTGDLRRSALLRSVQMRPHVHCPVVCELPLAREQEMVDCRRSNSVRRGFGS
ncbi:uncharacterized protein A4U43_C08F31930 [Asparagus officinalis]|uniref:uncharacterized protein LOC109822551 n=1 Tax=Asparagus officinalis TaxID=4686 RepID=UPI00098DECD1|nr:uncharacterized protein LOC109822551 [Asparagus officinalis]ONK61628.1 uncharacterized protein A4U43_C08F31930 [Asparagus officinalis]